MAAPDPPLGPDIGVPHAARVYDYLLGGAHNFAADRAAAEQILRTRPGIRQVAMANRAFLGRAVRACLARGARRFLDLGCGIPTAEPVHRIVHRHAPDARVAHVDVDPVAVATTRRVVAGVPGVTVTEADLTDPDAVLAAPGVAGLFDRAGPVAVLAVSVLHLVPDDALLAGLIDRYCDAAGAGGMLVVSHASTDVDDLRAAAQIRAIEQLARDEGRPVAPRDRATLRRLCHRVDPVGPGIVDVGHWRAAPDTARPVGMYAVVGDIVR